MGRMVPAKVAKHVCGMIRAWILLAGYSAVAAYVVDAEYGVRHAVHSSSDENRSGRGRLPRG